MTANPLKIVRAPTTIREPLTALEWAGEALERGHPKHHQLWMEEARRRGETGKPRFVTWDSDGSKRPVRVFG